MDFIRQPARALRLMDAHSRRWLAGLGVVGAGLALLDLVGLLLLAPLLGYVSGAPTQLDAPDGFLGSLVGATTREEFVVRLTLLAAAVFLAKGLLAIVVVRAQTAVLATAQLNIASRLLSAFAGAPWLVQQETSTGAFMRTSVPSVQGLAVVAASGLSGLADASVFLAVVAAVAIVDPWIALGAVVYLGILGLVYVKVVKRPLMARGESVQVEGERMSSALLDLVGGVRELTVRGQTTQFAERVTAAFRSYLASARVILVSNYAMRYFLESLVIVGVAILVVVVAALSSSIDGVLVSIGVLLAGAIRLLPALNTLLLAVNNVRANAPAIDFVQEELERLSSPSDGVLNVESTDRRALHRTEPSALPVPIQFVNVSFRYPGRDQDAVSGLNFTVRSGESLGIVGASGAGKSTLLDLMLGLLHPDTGEITAFGQPLDDVRASWRSSLGYVPQSIFLLDDTLEANIRLGLNGERSDERLAAAISTAGLDELVRQLPEGLATRVGEHGSRLSGGQRQRIGLARALYADPAVLLLDEATSALDNETEREVSRALQALHGRVTTVIIAHRLSTVKACDRILFLTEGRIAGEGDFMHLKATNSHFARLVALGSLLD